MKFMRVLGVLRVRRAKRQISLLRRSLFAVGLTVSLVNAQDDEYLVNFANEAATFHEQIEAIESDFGPFDTRLLEPLSALAELEIENGHAEAAAELLRRQLQISRNAFGFEDPRLLAVLDSLIRAEVAQSQWQQAADYLDLRSQLFLNLAEPAASSSAVQFEYIDALSTRSSWLVQQVALIPTRTAVRTFFDAREIEEQIADLSDAALDELQQLEQGPSNKDGETLLRWLPIVYRQAYNDYSLVQLLNARSGFSYDTIDYLRRREGESAMHKLSSPRYISRVLSSPLNRIPMLEKGDPIGIGYLRDAYFRVRSMDKRLEALLAHQVEIGISAEEIAHTRQALALVRIVRGDYQVLQKRGSGISEYKEAQALLREAGIAQEEIDRYFSRPTLIPSETLTLDFQAALDQIPEGECIANFTALSERLATLASPDIGEVGELLDFPEAEFLMRFDVSRRGRATGINIDTEGVDDARLRRAANRALKDLQFRPAVADGRTVRQRDVCMTFRIPIVAR